MAATSPPLTRDQPFRQPVQVIRWGTTTVGFVLSMPGIINGDRVVLACALGVVAYTAFRTVSPMPYDHSLSALLQLVAEATLVTLAVTATGFWSSPIVFSMLAAPVIGGFSAGLGRGLRLALAAITAVTIPNVVMDWDADAARLAALGSVLMVSVAVLAAYASVITGEAQQRHDLAIDRMGRLADANTLLFSLHQVAQTLPASLDLDEVLDSTLSQLRDLFEADVAVILLLDETDRSLTVARRFGAKLPDSYAAAAIPPPVARSRTLGSVVHVPSLLQHGGPGLSARAGSGLYAPLQARGTDIGVLAVESVDGFRFSGREADLLGGFAEPAALALDNAQWFKRLRTVGADEERTRIARDLHDRIGQSLAYLAFELDRIIKKNESGAVVEHDLDHLRDDVRGVVREVRDTLYDLRTDVSPDAGVPAVLEEFLGRVRTRSGLTITLDCDERARLPLNQERELWRIAQEAVVNAERHAEAEHLAVRWYADVDGGVVQVSDDGVGFPVGRSGRLDSYGLTGMRERAASIGARLEVQSEPGKGALVTATVGAPHADLTRPAVEAGRKYAAR